METIPFHSTVNQDKYKTPTQVTDPVTQQTQSTATTETVIGKAIVKLEPKHPHPKSKTQLPHLPTIPAEESKEEPETEIEPKFQPEIPEFEPYFQLPNTPDTSHPPPFNLSKMLPPPPTEFIPPPAVRRRKWAKSMINMSAFANIQPQAVKRILWIPNGDRIYLIRCDEDHWHDKKIDGQPWQMTHSSRQGLNGIKKFGTCRGSFICLNDDCPIYTAEWICNKVDFIKEKFGAYSWITLRFTIYNIDRPTWFNVVLDPILFLCLFNLLLHTISTINIITPKGTTAKITSNATRSISQVSITRPKFHGYLPLSFLCTSLLLILQ